MCTLRMARVLNRHFTDVETESVVSQVVKGKYLHPLPKLDISLSLFMALWQNIQQSHSCLGSFGLHGYTWTQGISGPFSIRSWVGPRLF